MADRVTIPDALAAEIRADLAAGGDRARRWRPDVATRQVLNLHDGDVCDVLAMPRPNGTLPVERAGIALSWLDAWAPVGGVDGGPRPEPGQRLLARRTPMRVHDGHVGICRSARPVIAEFNPEHPAERDLAGSFAVTEWAILPPEIPAEVHALRADLDEALDVDAGLAEIIGQPTPGDMWELNIRIPTDAFTRAPGEDPRLYRILDLAMGLFPTAMVTGGMAWPDDGPTQCPTCGAVDRDERRHRAHEDAETTLWELVRWLTTERERLHTEYQHEREQRLVIEARTLRVVLDHLRDQGLDVDYLGEPAAVPDVVAREALETGDAT